MSVCPRSAGEPRAGAAVRPRCASWQAVSADHRCHGGHQASARVEASVDGTMTMSGAPTYRTEPNHTRTANPDEPGCDDGTASGALTQPCRRPPAHQRTTPGLTQTVIPQLQSALAAQHDARFGSTANAAGGLFRIATNGPLRDTTV